MRGSITGAIQSPSCETAFFRYYLAIRASSWITVLPTTLASTRLPICVKLDRQPLCKPQLESTDTMNRNQQRQDATAPVQRICQPTRFCKKGPIQWVSGILIISLSVLIEPNLAAEEADQKAASAGPQATTS